MTKRTSQSRGGLSPSRGPGRSLSAQRKSTLAAKHRLIAIATPGSCDAATRGVETARLSNLSNNDHTRSGRLHRASSIDDVAARLTSMHPPGNFGSQRTNTRADTKAGPVRGGGERPRKSPVGCICC
jgi:hypothetical protein